MNEHLDKAKAALADAAAVDVALDAEKAPRQYARLLDLAQVQAWLAFAEATTRIADVIEEEAKVGGSLQALSRIASQIERHRAGANGGPW